MKSPTKPRDHGVPGCRPWRPALGAWPEEGSVFFRVWAPKAAKVDVVVETAAGQPHQSPLQRQADGTFSALIAGVGVGDRYRYRMDGQEALPDPASRFQPDGVHGSSEIVDASAFCWTDAGWRGIGLEEAVIYELHVGSFSPEGTFAGAAHRLPEMVDLGVTALELMPVAAFPGDRNWGYDGVDLFAPAQCYGRPDDMRRFVDAAHDKGLAVILDVVYNHFGPDGNYLAAYSPYYFSKKHHTSWGAAPNFDGPESGMVRAFFIENALHWIHEYHLDGLRLDATHAFADESTPNFLTELAHKVQAASSTRKVLLISEDARNLAKIVMSRSEGGWGLDAVWADDFHNQIRRLLAGDHEGYFRDFTGTTQDLAATIQQGWFYRGQRSEYSGKPRGTDPTGIPPARFVHCIQNHDQIGNRALGERLNHQVDLAAYRAASVLLFSLPSTPLLFMGQEWAASSPFLYFTNHKAELGLMVTKGRRQEFRQFSAFANAEAQRRIPDPQSRSTFQSSKLRWEERKQEPYASCLRFYQRMLKLRKSATDMEPARCPVFQAAALGETGVWVLRGFGGGGALLAVVHLKGSETLDLRGQPSLRPYNSKDWQLLLTTEDPAFCPDACPCQVALADQGPVIQFRRPGAVVFKHSGPVE